MQKVTKRRIALIQIEKSILLLEKYNDPISALTLAGAAEEILGKMVAKRGKPTIVEDSAEFLGQVYDFVGKPRPSKKELISAHNKIRNEIKHNDLGKNTKVQADFQFEAEDMLVRAIKNYFEVYNSLPKSQRIRNWFLNVIS